METTTQELRGGIEALQPRNYFPHDPKRAFIPAATKGTRMKKLLFFFPENPLEKNSGNKTRVLQLLRYFKTRNIEVDFVSVSPWTSIWSEKDAAALSRCGLASDVHVLRSEEHTSELQSLLRTSN